VPSSLDLSAALADRYRIERELDSGNVEARYRLGYTLLNSGRARDARPVLQAGGGERSALCDRAGVSRLVGGSFR
jgi:hypothetical protein